jgi:hypothetical protein
MTFKYYITDLHEGMVNGTNKRDVAESYATSEDYFVIDVESNEWLTTDNERLQIGEHAG